jgi:di/tricarboxylate transporter
MVMTGDVLLVSALLLATIALFASDRLRMDVVALLVILALMLTGLLSPREALSGFGDPLVVLIAGLFVVGEGLFRTGIAFSVGNWLMRVAGTSETRLLMLLMMVVAGLSAFMSNTGAVAIFIPIALNLAKKADVNPSRLLLPMAYAGSIGGMLTLIGTPPNLAVTTELIRGGMEPFNFFSFFPVGALILIVAILFILFVVPRLLPASSEEDQGQARLSLADLVQAYGLKGHAHLVQLAPECFLVGSTVGKAHLRTRFGVTVVGLARRVGNRRTIMPALIQTEYRAGDVLLLVGTEDEMARLVETEPGLDQIKFEQEHRGIVAREIGLAEVLLTPRSQLVGQTIAEVRFREDHGLSVLGILRRGEPVTEDLSNTRLEFGDSLLIGGGWRQIELLQRKKQHFTVLTLPSEMDEVAPNRDRAPWALGIVAGMLLLMTFSIVPSVTAVLLAGVAMVLARCVRMADAYTSVNWQSVVLIAGMLPMARALDKTGTLDLIVNALVGGLGESSPMVLMAGLFLLTSIFSQFISNTATAVLVAPIAIGAATGLGISPYPLLMTVAIAASTAFSTPMASPVNTLVIGPGGYRFLDFVKVGVPLQLLAMVITLLCVPLLFPF